MSHALQERLADDGHRRAHQGSGIRIVLCDDHQLLLEALATSLAEQGFTVEATVGSPAEAVRAVALHQPDVLVMDVNFPAGSGIEAAREVVAAQPRTKVVMITGSDDPEPMLEALSIGVSGYLRKDRKISAIADAVVLAVQGGTLMDKELLRSARGPHRKPAAERSALDQLTRREKHILSLLVDGMSTREMVQELGVSPSTVRTHVQNIFMKLGVHSRLSAVALLAEDPGLRTGTRPDAALG